MKKDSQTDENKSPSMASSSNKMMMSWLSKASKSSSTTDTKSTPEGNKSPIKKIDNNVQSPKEKENKTTTTPTKTLPSKLAKKSSPETDSSDDEIIVTKKSTKKEATKTSKPAPKETKTPPPKKETKSKSTKSKKVESSDESPKADEKKTPSAKKPANRFYAAYMRREGPKNPGSKPIPIGKPNCFAGLKFLTTGVLDSLDRDECKRIIEKYGGHIISGVTKKLDYLIVGEDSGYAKIQKANELNVKQINEDQFLQLICEKSGITNPTYEKSDFSVEDLDESMKKEDEEEVVVPKKKKKSIEHSDETKTTKIKEEAKSPIKSSN